MAFKNTEKLIHVATFVVVLFKVSFAYQPFNKTDPDYAASVYHLKLLVLTELQILASSNFANLISEKQFEKNTDIITKYVEDFESSHGINLNSKDPQQYKFITLLKQGHIHQEHFADETVKHPLKSYRTIWRFVRFINRNPQLFKTDDETKFWSFPKNSDLESAMQNILRLRQIFNLSVDDLLNGQLENLNTGSGLTLTHLKELAEHAIILKMYSHAVDLLDGIISRCNVTPLPKQFQCCLSMDLTYLKQQLDNVIAMHDDLLIGNIYKQHEDMDIIPPDSTPYVFHRPLISSTSTSFTSRKRIQVDVDFTKFADIMTKDLKLELDMAFSPTLFERLCGGVHKQENAVKRFDNQHQCIYLHTNNAYYLIGPLKAEIYHKNPIIIQIYDVLSNNEIHELRSEVQQELRQSRTTDENAVKDETSRITSRFRTSANAWIEDGTEEKFKYVNERISLITGLNTRNLLSTEKLQIAAYNPGGHYTPHTDAMFEEEVKRFLPESEIDRGDRIMTFMIYLSNVEKGGGTAFPTLKTVVSPVMGSAVLWYNLNPDGTINYDVLHGGCPVLYGTKWIANKWIRNNDQMFSRPCKKNKEAWRI